MNIKLVALIFLTLHIYANDESLINAVKTGTLEEVQLHLTPESNVNLVDPLSKRSLTQIAVDREAYDIARYLVSKGAIVNMQHLNLINGCANKENSGEEPGLSMPHLFGMLGLSFAIMAWLSWNE